MKKKILSIILVVVAISNLLVISASANNTKLVALTFDDGPNPKFTPGLLDALKERNVKATFFLVGYMIDQSPELAKRIYEEGHQLANHTQDHAWLSKLGEAAIRQKVGYVDNLLSEISGEEGPFMLRAPYGAVGQALKNAKISPIILWGVDPGNGNMAASEATMKSQLLKQVKDGSIIILHDKDQKNVNVALYAIDTLRPLGYEFVTVEELFRLRGITPVNGQVYYNLEDKSWETSYDETYLDQHWASGSIEAVQKAGIMWGDDTGFLPNGYMNRAMAATILKRLDNYFIATYISDPLGKPEGQAEPRSSSFTDVEAGSWYEEAVEWAAQKGYVLGVGDGRFNPNGNITKEQFYALLARYASDILAKADKPGATVSYKDDDRISGWARESINSFRATGFSSKNDPEIFRPGDFITRAEAAELVEYVMGLKQKQAPATVSAGGSDVALQCFLIGDSFLLNTYLLMNKSKAEKDEPLSLRTGKARA